MRALVFDNYKEKFKKLNKYLNLEEVKFEIIKFSNGEGKIVVNESVKDEEVIIFSDFSNKTSYTYNHKKREYSSDEYYVELKRLISAVSDSKSISLFLPLIYQSRQNSNKEKESKDYLAFIKDLKNIGVDKIITFEVHGEEKEVESHSLSPLFKDYDYDVVVSLDKGGENRAREYSKVLDCDLCVFSKVRDLSVLIEGSNPIKEYKSGEYDFTNKKVLIVDDILDSGSTLITGVNEIKNASTIDVFITYPLFNKGVKEIKKLIKKKIINNFYVSDLININKLTKYKFIKVIDSNEYVSQIIKE